MPCWSLKQTTGLYDLFDEIGSLEFDFRVSRTSAVHWLYLPLGAQREPIDVEALVAPFVTAVGIAVAIEEVMSADAAIAVLEVSVAAPFAAAIRAVFVVLEVALVEVEVVASVIVVVAVSVLPLAAAALFGCYQNVAAAVVVAQPAFEVTTVAAVKPAVDEVSTHAGSVVGGVVAFGAGLIAATVAVAVTVVVVLAGGSDVVVAAVAVHFPATFVGPGVPIVVVAAAGVVLPASGVGD